MISYLSAGQSVHAAVQSKSPDQSCLNVPAERVDGFKPAMRSEIFISEIFHWPG